MWGDMWGRDKWEWKKKKKEKKKGKKEKPIIRNHDCVTAKVGGGMHWECNAPKNERRRRRRRLTVQILASFLKLCQG